VSGRSDRRLVVLGVLLAGMMVVLAARTAQLVLVRGADAAAAAADNRTRQVPDPAPRGMILDSSGRPLVGNSPTATVSVDRSVLAELPDQGAAVLQQVADALGMGVRQLRQRLTPCADPGAPPRPVCDDGSPQAPVQLPADPGAEARLLAFAESPGRYPGVTVTETLRRTYPFAGIADGHLLGYLGAVSAEELAAGNDAAPVTMFDRVGRGGLEQQYDADLRGRSGVREVLVDAQGRREAVRQVTQAQPGNTLVTSIDAHLQQRVEQEVADAVARAGSDSARGSAVVLDAQTGRILALASRPGYDPREWVDGISESRYRQLSRGGALVDYAVQSQVPPGSVLKPVTAVAMQREGLRLDGSYPCPADYTAGGRTFANFDSEAFGQITLRRALEVSCNTVFYAAADRMWRRGGGERVAPDERDPVAQAAEDFGLGATTGVDLPGEAAGTVASPAAKHRLWLQRRDAWCAAAEEGYPRLRRTDPARADYYTALDRENCRSGDRWRQGDAINAAIGQGLTTVTPLQMASAYAAIANGGRLVRPTVARALIDPSGGVVRELPAQDRGRAPVPRATLAFLRTALSGVPLRGTAKDAFAGFPLSRHAVAGKTGSAQIEGSTSTSWFASFAPVADPRYVVVVMITEGGTGGENAAPAARGIYETIFGVGTRAAFPPSGPPQAIPEARGVPR
jgi:penicillin-binding protein 2